MPDELNPCFVKVVDFFCYHVPGLLQMTFRLTAFLKTKGKFRTGILLFALPRIEILRMKNVFIHLSPQYDLATQCECQDAFPYSQISSEPRRTKTLHRFGHGGDEGERDFMKEFTSQPERRTN